MRTKSGAAILTILLGLTAAGCDLTTGTPTTPAPIPPIATVTTTGTEPLRNTVVVPLSAFTEMGPGWAELFLAYGEDETNLGATARTGGFVIGPQYGTQTPDGRWWFLDTAKRRVARFTPEGAYMDQIEMSGDTLLNGNFTFQRPTGLNDNTVAAYRLDGPTTSVLRTFGESFSLVTIDRPTPWLATDGVGVYGLSQDGSRFKLDPWAGVTTETDWFFARNGSRYRLTASAGDLLIELPDRGVETTLQIRLAEQPEIEIRFEFQVETGADGSLFLLVYGTPLSDETLEVGGLITLDPQGLVARTQLITNPSTPADPGVPAQLGVTPGTSSPWLMVIEPQGVRIHLMIN